MLGYELVRLTKIEHITNEEHVHGKSPKLHNLLLWDVKGPSEVFYSNIFV